jgi:hypothetical protein
VLRLPALKSNPRWPLSRNVPDGPLSLNTRDVWPDWRASPSLPIATMRRERWKKLRRANKPSRRLSFIPRSNGEAPEKAKLDHLHHEAHEVCFIANSVKTQVTVAS